MKVTEILSASKRPFASFELVPPLKGSDISKLYNSIAPLMEFAPPFLNITSHRDEIEYQSNPDGSFRRVTVTKRPGTVAITAAIMKEFKVEVVPHVICGGQTIEQVENILVDLNFLGIENIMALRGDAIPGEKYFSPTPGGHSHTDQLIRQIERMNKGEYLDSSIKNAVPTSFCIGAAGYPEKHCEAPNLKEDIEHLKTKVEAGAGYIVTQMFFNNQSYFNFVKECRDAGIRVPIIPGIKPISTKKHIELLPRAFSIDLPEDLISETNKCKDNKEIYRVGVEWSIAQCKELLAKGCPAIHFYTMGKAENVQEIVKQLF